MAAISDLLTLAAGGLSLELVPAIGGSVASFKLDGIGLMRALAPADHASGNVLGTAMFPMVPYANRIAGNAFSFEGNSYGFHANNPPEIFNVHGTGWHRPWRVADASETTALLVLEVNEPGEPYAYRATQRFTLRPDGLAVEMSLANAGGRRLPFGMGLHPWFDRDGDVDMQFQAESFYLEEPDQVPGERITLPPELAFDIPRPLPHRWRCNDYGGWDGVATIRFPGRGVGLTMRAEPIFKHLMVYADPKRAVFCVEPQTNASGAFNRHGGFDDPDEGVIVLAPGESTSGIVWFEGFRV